MGSSEYMVLNSLFKPFEDNLRHYKCLHSTYINIFHIWHHQFLESQPAVPLTPLLPASSPAGPSYPAEAGRESPSYTCHCWELQPLCNLQQPIKQQPGSSPPIPVCEAQEFEAGDPAKKAD